MTKTYSMNARTSSKFSCIIVLLLLTACGEPMNGYYDSKGNFVSTEMQNNTNNTPRYIGSVRNDEKYARSQDRRNHRRLHPQYDRLGYYDHTGHYVADDGILNVPENMFPPRGMCRIWFVERPVAEQPGIETCSGIESRIPTDAYVVYGG